MSLAGDHPGYAASGESPRDIDHETHPPAPAAQSWFAADAKSAGCMTCHTKADAKTMHRNEGVVLGCTDCHGGDPAVKRPAGSQAGGPEYRAALDAAHVQPRFPETWDFPSSANPKRSYTLLNQEAPEYLRFVNPSDYRVVREACGACHLPTIMQAERSLMATTAMFWGGAAYNNGILPFKNYVLGEAYTRAGQPAGLESPVAIEPWMTAEKSILPKVIPLPAWEVTPPGDIFRVFERGGRVINSIFPEIALPNIQTQIGGLQRLEEPGRPDIRQSNRGPGTGLRVAVPVLNLHKTRLNDPNMWFLGTNDQPGDYRSSGCAACHVVYANDRDPKHSGPYAEFGHEGQSQSADPTIPKDESGHPLEHAFTRAIPTSQCMICHMHQPNMFVNSYLGYTMWDYESDAPTMWPEAQQYPSTDETWAVLQRNPEGAAPRGKWADLDFLKGVSELNPELEDTQFADYHGHGWNFRGVFKKDRKGNKLTADGDIIDPDDPNEWEKAVHLSSVHADKGMHCVDCHFAQDTHGTGYIHGEVAAAVQIRCKDCHGTADSYPTLRSSGPAAPPGGNQFGLTRTEWGERRFEWQGEACDRPPRPAHCKLIQRSAVWPDKSWELSLVKDTVDPDHTAYNEKATRAKLMGPLEQNGQSQPWGPGIAAADRAHKEEEMACYTCHLSWTTTCSGCHLPIEANWKTDRHHYEGGQTRNYATYNPQVARDQAFQLGIHQTAKGNIVAPVRSSSALVLSSKNINRERIYTQQPPISAAGYSSQAFAPHFPHTVRKTETKTCSDCHLSVEDDNNAWMAQLLLQGTNFLNFVGFHTWVGTGNGVEAVRVTEWEEPQAILGSYLHKYAYPDWYQDHLDRGQELKKSWNQPAEPVRCLQLRGEYLLAAEGPDGTIAYDVASISNKGVSDRIIEAPFSPLGHDPRVASADATCVALPTTQPVHPPRNEGELMREANQEQPFHPIYNYAYVSDAQEGLIAIDVNTLADGEARNNFLDRQLTWNPDGVLDGARHLEIAGTTIYIAADAGLVIVDADQPLDPRVVTVLPFDDVRASFRQFRYLFVTDATGLHVVDVTNEDAPVQLPEAHVALEDARKLHVSRTFAYVAAGAQGLAIIDVQKPREPEIYEFFDAGGRIDDARDVIVASTNASLFAYIADGANGLKIVQLTSPSTQPRFYGFSPDPKPELVAWWRTEGPSLALSRPLERDRAVDEDGNQVAIFGRLGSRPFTEQEMEAFYINPKTREPWTVQDNPDQSSFVAGPTRAR